MKLSEFESVVINLKAKLEKGEITKEEFEKQKAEAYQEYNKTAKSGKEAELFLGIFIIGLGWWMGWMFGVFPPYGSSSRNTSPAQSKSSFSDATIIRTIGEWNNASAYDKWGTAENYVVSSQSRIPGYEDRAKSLYTQKVRNCLDEAAKRYPSSESISGLASICVAALPHMQ